MGVPLDAVIVFVGDDLVSLVVGFPINYYMEYVRPEPKAVVLRTKINCPDHFTQ